MSTESSSYSTSTAGDTRYTPSAPRRIQSEYDMSIHGGTASSSSGSSKQKKGHSATPRWLRQVKDWMSTSEPSAKAMKDEMIKVQRRPGAKSSHRSYPGGQIPEGIITSTSGPRPETAYQQSVLYGASRGPRLPTSPTVHSFTSSGSWAPSTSSLKESNPVAPWES